MTVRAGVATPSMLSVDGNGKQRHVVIATDQAGEEALRSCGQIRPKLFVGSLDVID